MTAAEALLSVAALLLAEPAFAAALHIEVQDERGVPVWTPLAVRNHAGQEFQPPGSVQENTTKSRARGPFYLVSFIVHGMAGLDLVPGLYTVIAEHGLECERIEREIWVNVGRLAKLRVRIRPWIRMWPGDWRSGDMHVHRAAPEFLSRCSGATAVRARNVLGEGCWLPCGHASRFMRSLPG